MPTRDGGPKIDSIVTVFTITIIVYAWKDECTGLAMMVATEDILASDFTVVTGGSGIG